MDKDFMLHYFNKAVQSEWEELLKTPRYQQTASKRDDHQHGLATA